MWQRSMWHQRSMRPARSLSIEMHPPAEHPIFRRVPVDPGWLFYSRVEPDMSLGGYKTGTLVTRVAR